MGPWHILCSQPDESAFIPILPPHSHTHTPTPCPYCLPDMDERFAPLLTTSEDCENGSIICLLAARYAADVNFHNISPPAASCNKKKNKKKPRPFLTGTRNGVTHWRRRCKSHLFFFFLCAIITLSLIVIGDCVLAVPDTPPACTRHGQRRWARAPSTTSACR